ncbi:hypothetical protein ACNO5E_26170 [Vibrio parahaemolyticus]|uniref:hypothetical protein n=1 Tax=Vibrio parahaemolyticus TaxID=670 RepID=UPI00081356DC|nr:hypothetical protein [Vibrio parahaemolyticus]
MEHLDIQGLITARWHRAEFCTMTTEAWNGRYNPTPKFYQALVDAGKHEDLPIIELLDNDMFSELSLPWVCEGLIHIDGSKVYLIDNSEWDGYTQLEMYRPIASPADFKNAIVQVVGLIKHGYKFGLVDGKLAKQKEIKEVLGL